MAEYQLTLPKMGESVAEATLIKWVKNIGDTIIVTNGLGLIIYATIHQAEKKNAYFTVDKKKRNQKNELEG